jgi:protein-L-isoaspartate(D-aspartate) O-methyltransferase
LIFNFQQQPENGSTLYFGVMKLEDNYRHKGLRKKLLENLQQMGISDQRVLDAINAVPRHYFLSSAFLEIAYENRAFQIGEGQTISHPFTVATQSVLLDTQPGMKVLEIGTGSGFQAAVLCQLGVKVYSIERHQPLHLAAKSLFQHMHQIDRKFNPTLVYGDGYKGLPAFAPFDRIIITCAVPDVPEKLLLQLKPGGKLVMPFGKGAVQQMMVIQELEDGTFHHELHGSFSFVPMLEERKSVAAKKMS